MSILGQTSFFILACAELPLKAGVKASFLIYDLDIIFLENLLCEFFIRFLLEIKQNIFDASKCDGDLFCTEIITCYLNIHEKKFRLENINTTVQQEVMFSSRVRWCKID